MTRQREIMLKILRSEECIGRHRTADEILLLAKRSMPSISRATVYNNLRELEREGLIRRITGDFGADLYDASFVLHSHLICTECGEIRDVQTPSFLSEFSSLVGEELDAYELKMRYICKKCKEKYTKQEENKQ